MRHKNINDVSMPLFRKIVNLNWYQTKVDNDMIMQSYLLLQVIVASLTLSSVVIMKFSQEILNYSPIAKLQVLDMD